MNEKKRWNSIAPTYNEEIFDVYQSDKNKVLPRYLKKHGNKAHTVLDFGCGNGKSFSFLSPLFKNILAIDISQGLIGEAKRRPYSNVEFKTLDLSRHGLHLPQVDFVFCCNVIMLPEVEKNYHMFRNIHHALKPGGTAVIIIPSMESGLFSLWRMIDLYRKEGTKLNDIPSDDLDYMSLKRKDIMQGILAIDKVPTKHYTAPEIEVIIQGEGLRLTSLEKVEYKWDSEFSEPPEWMKEPYPWDWLVECKK